MITRCVKLLFKPSFISAQSCFCVVLGQMGRTLKHVRCKVFCNICLSYLSINRISLRPSGQDKDVYNFILGGPNIDYDKISTSEEFAKFFYSFTKRTDILFGDIIWVSKYRLERTLFFYCADNICPHKTEHPYG